MFIQNFNLVFGITFFTLILNGASPLKAQEVVFSIAEIQPEFPGGSDALQQYLSESLKYPENALLQHVQGDVYVGFVVSSDGSIDKNSLKVLRSVHPELDAEALRLVEAMPNWIPGKQQGKNVNVEIRIPVGFHMTDNPSHLSHGDVATTADVMPQFPGGEQALRQYLEENLRYPEVSRWLGSSGIVEVRFVVKSDGYIEHLRVARGVGLLLDEEALRVVRNMPQWIPGKIDGKQVDVEMTIPVRFQILRKPTHKDYGWKWPEAQDKPRSLTSDAKVLPDAEILPEFPGGEEGLNEYMARYVKYPQQAQAEKIGGTVFILFNVMANGWVDTASVAVEKSVHPQLDAEAMRLVREMPRWNPGYDRGQVVNVSMRIPIFFYVK